MERRTSSRTPALKSSAMIEVPAGVVKGDVISKDSAVGDVGVVVVDDTVEMPIISQLCQPQPKPPKKPIPKPKPNAIPGPVRYSPGYQYQPGQAPIGSPYASQGSYSGT